jgi:PAS domain S-box-containing protein
LKKVAQDVTETKKKDRAVIAMASELRQLVDTANAPIFGIDVHGRVNEWNDKTAEITGFSKEEAWNKPLVSDFIEPAFKDAVQQVLDDALRGKETSNYELTFLTKSKEIRYLLVNATTRRDAEGNVVGVVGGQYRFCARKRAHSLRFTIFYVLPVSLVELT